MNYLKEINIQKEHSNILLFFLNKGEKNIKRN